MVAAVVTLVLVKELVEVVQEVIVHQVMVQVHYKTVQYFYHLEIIQLQLELVELVELVLVVEHQIQILVL